MLTFRIWLSILSTKSKEETMNFFSQFNYIWLKNTTYEYNSANTSMLRLCFDSLKLRVSEDNSKSILC